MIISTYYLHLVAASRQTGLPFAEVAQRCYDHGLRGVDVLMLDINDECLQHVEILRSIGYTICSLPAHTDFLHNPSIAEAERIVDTAHALGASVIMAIPGLFNEDEDREKARQTSLTAIKHMCRYAAPYGIHIGVENYDHPLSAVAGIEGIQWYLSALPQLHCIFDTGNFAFMGDDIWQAYEQFKDRIHYQIHCNDRTLTPPENGCPRMRATHITDYPVAVGSGCIPHKEFLTNLLSCGFDGIITIENFNSPNALEDILSSVTFIKSLCSSKLIQ